MDNTYTLIVDIPESGVLRLTLQGTPEPREPEVLVPYEGHVDKVLLTAVDNLLRKNTLDQSVLVSVTAGPGIDKNSSLYRIVTSFGSAVAQAHTGHH